MSRPRDSQRKRVYTAENRAFGVPCKEDAEFPCLENAIAFVREVTQTEWWLDRGGWAEVEVLDGRGRKRGKAYPPDCIALPVFTRRRWYILHELAHLITRWDVAWHGPEFCARYLELVERFMSKQDANELRHAFKEMKVKVRPKKSAYEKFW